MRQIKFRAWDKKYKEMINDIHIAPEYDWLVLSDNDALAERDNRGRGDDDGYELMQFTGLQDKNGKEIYEGDIIKFYLFLAPMGDAKEELRGKIIFKEGSYYTEFFNEWKGDGDGTMDDRLSSHLLDGDGSEVIGNIYENPELLDK
jgi:uncharacterized phage protein (TIGR01671 family)